MVYLSIKDGKGKSPSATSTVEVNYRGTLTNGKEFDSSYKRNQSISFPLTGVIPCWTEGVQMMKVGGKAKLVCPPQLPTVPEEQAVTCRPMRLSSLRLNCSRSNSCQPALTAKSGLDWTPIPI
jgi:hypothetical protein